MNARMPNHFDGQRSAGRVPSVSLALFGVAVLVYLLPQATDLLQYDRGSVAGGEVWRVVTCQWTHWNRSHLMWDAAMFLALGAMCERVCRARFVACVVVSALLIPALGVIAASQMTQFRGLSGLDSALFVLLAVHLVRTNRHRDPVVASAAALGLGLFAAKTVFECITGSIIFVQPETTFTPVPFTHIVGGAIGFIMATWKPGSDRESGPSAARVTGCA